ncbi:MAG: transglycosylase SLT domain-containing protein [bacterium]|nr:transglycosylase SLT domain-containing protein [bacterium]
MRRRRNKYEYYLVAILAVAMILYFIISNISAESNGVNAYSVAIKTYKNSNYEQAYQEFKKVPINSSLKEAALFRQARCATNLGDKELAVRKYKKIIHSRSKSTIVPISEYNMATLLVDLKDKDATKHFKNIIKKYPSSDYAIASNYYLGLISAENIAGSEKHKIKQKNIAFNYFKNYLVKAPNGRFSNNVADEIIKLDVPLHNYDNLLIAKAFYENGEYEKAKLYLNKTTQRESWTDFAKNEFRLGNLEKARYYTNYGLKDFANSVKQEDIIEVIDNYISTYPTRKEGIQSLVAQKYNSAGADYIAYLNCSEIVEANLKDACFSNAYKRFPNGQYSAETLYSLFMEKYLNKKYNEAQRLGFLHIKKFPNTKSSPAILYYMGRIAFKNKHYESANNYYNRVLTKYPDSYYAYRANVNLYKDNGAFPYLNMNYKPVVFPYKKSLENNFVIKLALLKDYDLVEELCKKDKFIQSWIAYEKGNYTVSTILARQAMDEIAEKPSFEDLRWRLIYPQHYFEIIENVKGNNNPIIIESIIKEESHFNKYAKSFVGAGGLMQLMPATFNEIATNNALENDIFSEETNIKAGCIYYSNLKKVLGNKDLYAISAYNGGIGSVINWFSKLNYNDTDEFVEQIPYPETKNYVKKVLKSYWMYGNLYQ